MTGSCGVLSTLVLWALCSLQSCQAGAPSSGNGNVGGHLNGTLLFDSPGHGGSHSLRNCSCAAEIQDCDEALANLLCSCRTVPRSTLPPGGLRMQGGGLTVWVREQWVLRELLNGSAVQDLRLSACSHSPFPPAQPIALFGLQRLRLRAAHQGAAHPEQILNIVTATERGRGKGRPSPSSSTAPPFLVSFLDVALLNGLSPLKAYSVSSPPVPSLAQHFPHLPLPPQTDPDAQPQPQQDCLLTFIY
ncbi:hypothetical protein AGOR_G00057920 [Albula goreensis]|uniref:Uncharacterized protein n=1 Tax=Albula goreensis TaxID=1534307 RepID=A0A8T3DPT3_9TELE|nr:hypothetical protein AGOR_G00057920 [Albula goreensis]